jgi:DNA polymerase-3 subunit delta
MVQGALRKILKSVMPERNGLNCVKIDLGESDLSEVAAECSYLPLGEERKCVIVDNAAFLGSGEGKSRGRGRKKPAKADSGFLEYLSHPDESVDLFFLVYSESLNERSPYFEPLRKAKAVFSLVSVFTPEQWRAYIPRFFEKRGYVIEGPAVSELSKRIAGDYARFLSEAQKLVSYCLETKRVALKDVKDLVAEPLEEDSYHLANALCVGDNKKALRIYRDLKLRSVDEVSLIRLVANQFRFLNEVRYLHDRGVSPEDIGHTLFASTGRVNVSLSNLRRMGGETLNEGLEQLYRCEFSIMTGKTSPQLAFTLFLSTFSL